MPVRHANIELVRALRAAWRRVQAKRGVRTITIVHVKSHTGVPGNELADKLAYEGMMADPDELRGRALGLPMGRSLMNSIGLAQAARAEDHRSSPWGDGPTHHQHNTPIHTTPTTPSNPSPAAPLVSPLEHPAHGDG